jgi:Lon protease-like protein
VHPQDLPRVVPLIPLAEPLLLPGTVVPVHAEEDWVQALAEDVLAGDGYVAVIQPLEDEDGAVYSVGCLGKLEMGREDNPDEVLIGGVIRFRLIKELPSERGYRRAVIDCGEFVDDMTEIEAGLEFTTLKELARQRVVAHSPEFDTAMLDRMAGTEIATALAHALPFSASERQALVEAPSLREIEQVLLHLMTGPGQSPGFGFTPLPVC